VHLSTSFDKAKEAASVHTDNPVILEVDAETAQQDGVDILTVNDDIVLARGIPPEYISVVEESGE
jgi:putative RNA 2'-phosphotransferase